MDQSSKKQYEELVLESDRESVSSSVTEDISDFFIDYDVEKEEETTLLTHLKELILSIDWEISNDVLGRLSRELRRLKDVWVEDRINLVYVQAMEKLARYVYVEKGDAHPGALKLLSRFYQRLEEITASAGWSEAEKKELLADDVKLFLLLKEQIQQGIVEKGHFGDSAEYVEEESVAPVFEKEQFDAKVDEDDEDGTIVLVSESQQDGLVEDADPGKEEDDFLLEVEEEEKEEEYFVEEDEPVEELSSFLVLEEASEEESVKEFSSIPQEVALQGINVDTEADDDTDEVELPRKNGELVPALSDVLVKELGVDVDAYIESSVAGFFAEEGGEEKREEPAEILAEEEQPELAFEPHTVDIADISDLGGDGTESVTEEEIICSDECVLEESNKDVVVENLVSIEREREEADPFFEEFDDSGDSVERDIAVVAVEEEPMEIEDSDGDLLAEEMVDIGKIDAADFEDISFPQVSDDRGLLSAVEGEEEIEYGEDESDFSSASAGGMSFSSDISLLINYCKELQTRGNKEVLVEILSLHDRLVEEMEGQPLELHLLLLFASVVDYIEGHAQVKEVSVLLLISIADTLEQVLKESDVMEAQKLLLRESARVLEWFGGLVE